MLDSRSGQFHSDVVAKKVEHHYTCLAIASQSDMGVRRTRP